MILCFLYFSDLAPQRSGSCPVIASGPWCRKASELRPQEPKYVYTLAFYLNQKGDKAEAVGILNALVEAYPQYKDAEMLLKEISR
jgi:predicted Zn-dependent protease